MTAKWSKSREPTSCFFGLTNPTPTNERDNEHQQTNEKRTSQRRIRRHHGNHPLGGCRDPDRTIINLTNQRINIMNYEPILLITDASGIYIPQRFVEEYASEWNLENVSKESIESLKDVDDEFYWDAWIDVEQNATHKDGYSLHQDGDLWAIPNDMPTYDDTLENVRSRMKTDETGASKTLGTIEDLISQAKGSLYGYHPMSFHTDALQAWFNGLDLPSHVWFEEGFGEFDSDQLKQDVFGKDLMQYV